MKTLDILILLRITLATRKRRYEKTNPPSTKAHVVRGTLYLLLSCLRSCPRLDSKTLLTPLSIPRRAHSQWDTRQVDPLRRFPRQWPQRRR
jgi:hypothetical protein